MSHMSWFAVFVSETKFVKWKRQIRPFKSIFAESALCQTGLSDVSVPHKVHFKALRATSRHPNGAFALPAANVRCGLMAARSAVAAEPDASLAELMLCRKRCR
ncbi:hypothetical protein SAMN05216387_10878 [Nitrosovibrio tenuis]|uniref:Uncharacterized protein n=1 Tax=Nitrosovibrio tenuis TaxID=1233 RepID=A0A1H7P7C9_9PROT|nr:hypothetical protein SAMN05216387_10878 [Nitrosovibrio tenuis]